MATLRELLTRAQLLLGLTAPTQKPQSQTLVDVLSSRLDAYRQLDDTTTAQAVQQTDTQLQRQTAQAALDLLTAIAHLATKDSPSTSANHAPPLFGARDIKAIGMLAGVLGRWGVQADLEVAQQKPKIAEIEEEQEEDRRTRLLQTVRRIVEEVLQLDLAAAQPAQATRSDSSRQLVQLVLSQFLGPLTGALVELSAGKGDEGENGQKDWAGRALQGVVRSLPPPQVLSTLLALLSTLPRSLSAARQRIRLSSFLSSQLLRPSGVRSLLIVVIGAGAAPGEEEEVGGRKAEMVRRLMSVAPSSGRVEQQAYFTNLTAQLLAILHSAATSAVSSNLSTTSSSSSVAGKGKAPEQPRQTVNANAVPLPILRAACYVLAHFAVAETPTSEGEETSSASEEGVGRFAKPALLAALHGPLQPAASSPSSPLHTDTTLLTSTALYTHLTLLTLLTLYSPPLPSLLPTLLTPLLAPLLSLLSHLASPPLIVSAPTPAAEQTKQGIEDEVKALLGTLARGEAEVARVVKAAAWAVEVWERGEELGAKGDDDGEGVEADWGWGEDGAPTLVLASSSEDGDLSSRPAPPQRNFLVSEDDEAEDGEDSSPPDVDLRVNPLILTSWLLHDVQRKELTAGLFLRWLDEVKTLQLLGTAGGVEGAKRCLIRLQLILALVDPDTGAGPDILTSPQEIIAFVAHALEAGDSALSHSSVAPESASATTTEDKAERNEIGGGLKGLRIVEKLSNEGAKIEEVQDEGDEAVGLGTGFGKDEMAMTALTLLLAVLEANDTLDDYNTPLLPVISSQLDVLSASTSSPILAPLAREAKMVLSLRRASSSFASSHPNASTSTTATADDPFAQSRETYRTALKLLQDPLLPVRAQGLHLLRTLILDRTSILSTDPALLPAALDVFVLALEEEDSFLYLNAVQGLSSLVDVFGRQVVGRLMEVYTGTRKGEREREGVRETGTGEKGRREVDKRLRVGEALVQVVQRAGEALAVFVDDLLPSLLLVLRTSTLPIPLRASSLTILATCVETAPTAILPHVDLLAEACVTLLQVESVALKPWLPAARREEQEEESAKVEVERGKGKGVLIEEVDTSDSDDDLPLPPPTPPQLGKDGRPRRPEELSDPTTTTSSHPTLRRGALVFLAALIRTLQRLALERTERENERLADAPVEGLLGGVLKMPGREQGGGRGTLLFSREGERRETERRQKIGGGAGLLASETLVKAKRVLRYVSETDEDGLVRHQAGEVLEELEE